MRKDIPAVKWARQNGISKEDMYHIVRGKMSLARARYGYNSENYAYWFNKMTQVKNMPGDFE